MTSILITKPAVWLATLALLTHLAPAWSETSPTPLTPVPLQDFARRPSLSQVSFSPSGEKFAAVRRDDKTGRDNIVVGDLSSGRLLQITNFSNIDVSTYTWVGEGRILFSVRQNDKGLMEQRLAGTWFAINTDGSDGRDLTDKQRGFSVLRRIPGQDTDILVLSPVRDQESPDVVRLNTRTGKRTVVSQRNPGHVERWVLDAQDVPRAAVSCKGESLSCTFWFRANEQAPWARVGIYADDQPSMKPLVFTAHGELLVESSLGTGDRAVVQILDPQTLQPGEVLVDLKNADADASPILDPNSRAVLGLETNGDRPGFVWFDEATAKVHQLVDNSLPAGNVNQLRKLDNGKYLVISTGDRNPVAYYQYDPQKARIEELLRPNDWLQPERLAHRTPFRYKARDGLEIPGYLTLPQGKSAHNLPLIAWIHGGPWARDEWGWDTDAQFFASRGYAVFQPNYRGSTGYGLHHLTAGYRQLGLAMQDDITDGIQDLIRRGVVDPKRICIGGASYGGYATMMGLIKEPGLFRCGIDVMGVTDLRWWHDLGYTDFNLSNPAAAGAHLDRAVGDPSQDKVVLEANSPRLHADRVRAPVLIIHGSDDSRVPIVHAEAMRDALIKAGQKPEWVVYPGEGHGFSTQEHRIDYYQRMGDFLDRHIGDRTNP